MDLTSISNYLLDQCFDFIHLKELVSERILFYANLVAMFYANLQIRMSPLTLYSLVRETIITLDETLMGAILGISTAGPQIFGKDFATLNWNTSEALFLLFGGKS